MAIEVRNNRRAALEPKAHAQSASPSASSAVSPDTTAEVAARR